MSAQEITRKTCDQCRKTEEADKERSFGVCHPFVDWVQLEHTDRRFGHRAKSRKDFCSFKCLQAYIEETKQ